jgi:hypothetical protein
MPTLLAIVSVSSEHRVWCSEVGCGHTICKAIHVVQDGTAVFILGSTCFDKRYGGRSALGKPSYGNGSGRQLTEAERNLLANNTSALLAQFENEVQNEGRLRQDSLSRRIPPPLTPRPIKPTSTQQISNRSFGSPWPWAEAGRSMFYIRLKDGTGWVRVQHKDGYQRLVPSPQFDGWDEALPSSVGLADLELGCLHVKDIASTLTYLRQFSVGEKVVGSWRELSLVLKQSLER